MATIVLCKQTLLKSEEDKVAVEVPTVGAVAIAEEDSVVIVVTALPLLHQPLQQLPLRIADYDAAVLAPEHVYVVSAVCA